MRARKKFSSVIIEKCLAAGALEYMMSGDIGEAFESCLDHVERVYGKFHRRELERQLREDDEFRERMRRTIVAISDYTYDAVLDFICKHPELIEDLEEYLF
ncbi:MAG: hypothetical protein DRP01_00670 [Archaeoglobales archaeon]|nr:MAG: hypothetical protein DRP01_00670 [Archaeoglobales archaeon]